ncbi:MAG: Mur ligase family protein [Gemmatimonadota bacterium]
MERRGVTGDGIAGRLPLLEAGLPASDALAVRLFPALGQGVEFGLERIRAVLAEVGNPHERYPTLHIGGTNGKGSVASVIASVLGAAGLRVGLYTSPHLCSFRERVQVAGRPAETATFLAAADELRPAMVRHEPTFFEAATALAFKVFELEAVDVAVVEVGLGGRLDATNVIHPLVSAVTNVALDHAEYLGTDLASIAGEKAAIAKPGVPLLTCVREPELLDVFRRTAEERGASFHPMHPAEEVRQVEVAAGGTAFTLDTVWGALALSTPLAGAHQAANAALAVRVLEHLPESLRPDADAVRRGLSSVRWPGRVQIERVGGRTWVFDVAHNAAGVRALAEALEQLALPRPLVVLTAVLGDKDWRTMLPPLFRLADRAFLTQADSAPLARRWDPAEAGRVVGSPPPLEIVPDFREALARAGESAGEGTVVVTGSCHTVGDALLALGMEPFKEPFAAPLSTRSA